MHAEFCARFGRADVTVAHIKALCSRRGWSAGPEGRRRNAGASFIFSPDELAWIADNAALPRPEVLARFIARFGRHDVTLDQIVRLRKRRGLKTGRDGRFEKGLVPWSKGKKIGSHPNSAATQFKSGQAAVNALPLGTERLHESGYVEVKVAEENPYTGAPTRFAMKHRHLWEAINGPVPEGCALKCLDGDRTNCDAANWIAVPRGLLPRLNGRFGRDYDAAPAALKPVIMATARLEHQARKVRQDAKERTE